MRSWNRWGNANEGKLQRGLHCRLPVCRRYGGRQGKGGKRQTNAMDCFTNLINYNNGMIRQLRGGVGGRQIVG